MQTSKAGSLPHEKGKIRIIKAKLFFFLLKAISKRSIDIYGMHTEPLYMYINRDVHISKLVSCMSNKRYQEQSESNQNRKMSKHFQLPQRPKDYLLPSRHRELRKNAEGRKKRCMPWRTSGAENTHTHMANHQIIPHFNGEQRNTKQKQTFDFLHRLGGTKILHLAKLPLGAWTFSWPINCQSTRTWTL